MYLDSFAEIKEAEKSRTLNEQKEHITSIKETVGHLLKKEKPLAHLHSIYAKIEEVENLQNAGQDVVKISPDLIAEIKALSEHPAVSRTVKKRPPVQKNCRTLFDYTM